MKRILLSMMITTLALPALAIEDTDGTFGKLTAEQRQALAETLDLSVVDGPATRLRLVVVVQQDRLCGLANVKNRMGAYMGFRAFFADLDRQEMHIAGEEMPPGKAQTYAALMQVNCF